MKKYLSPLICIAAMYYATLSIFSSSSWRLGLAPHHQPTVQILQEFLFLSILPYLLEDYRTQSYSFLKKR